MMEETDKDILMQAQNNRLDDLLVYFALYSFSRKIYGRPNHTCKL